MKIRRSELLRRADVDHSVLEVWIEEEWILPTASSAPDSIEPLFSEADIARGHLIQSLQADFGVNPEGVGIVLNLVDQVHDLRAVLAELVRSKRAPNGDD